MPYQSSLFEGEVVPLAHIMQRSHAVVCSFSTFPYLVSFYYPESHKARDQKQITLSLFVYFQVDYKNIRPCLS